MKCKRASCLKEVTLIGQVYCSRECAPFAKLSPKGPSKEELNARLADPVPRAPTSSSSLLPRVLKTPKEVQKKLTHEEILRFQKRACLVARKRGYPELADDFAQEVFVAFSRGWHSTVDQLFIEFLRSEYGTSRTAGGRARSAARARTVSLDEEVGEGEGSVLHHEVIGGAEPDPDPFRDLGRFAYLFRGFAAQVFDLTFIRNVSQIEIAEIFGVTGSRVSQVTKGIRNQLRDELALEEVRGNLEVNPEESLLEVSWLTL